MKISSSNPTNFPTRALGFAMMLFCAMGCANDSTDDLIAPQNTPDAPISYTNNVAAVINANCTVCHGASPVNGAPMSLVSYEQVKQAVLERGLIDRISRPQGAEGMMPNGGTRLPQNTIDMIAQWDAEGLLE
ncbi:hypothetical protein [Flavobacterium caeni]|uniref:Cytochrome c domain-containing protein n=1 Tax=Flavobacterium caeni TaxID=490189 RepID=A0A1G5HPM8_9FLAO|nr:hypothetical protein [Flavobacterium caeni]SCY65687.1 hypothetical protein SAMN02927903_01943 [Flavobacterium caeni]